MKYFSSLKSTSMSLVVALFCTPALVEGGTISTALIDNVLIISGDADDNCLSLDFDFLGNVVITAPCGRIDGPSRFHINDVKSVMIDMKRGRDRTFVSYSPLLFVPLDLLEIVTGRAADEVLLFGVKAKQCTIRTGYGDDTVLLMGGCAILDLDIRTSRDADNIGLASGNVFRSVVVKTGKGADCLAIDGICTESLEAFTNEGRDVVTITESKFDGLLRVQMGQHNDSLLDADNTYDPLLRIFRAEFISSDITLQRFAACLGIIL